MRKCFLIAAALLFCMTSNVNAGKKIVFTRPTTPIIKPKAPQANPTIIYGDYDTGGLTISFSGYDGDVIVSFVNATTGDISMSEEVIIESPDMMTIDLSTLSHSTYYVLIELDNGDCYYATIRI